MEPYYPFKNGSVEDFTIGSENCDNKIGYCNGPLKSGSTYRVKVRAFTAPDKFTDTSYSFPIQTGESDRVKSFKTWKKNRVPLTHPMSRFLFLSLLRHNENLCEFIEVIIIEVIWSNDIT